MGTLGRDVLYALRALRRTPAFTVTAIVAVALGVGASSAVFSIANAVFFRPIPFADPERIVHLAWQGDGHLQALSATKFNYWREHAASLDATATWRVAAARTSVATDEAPSLALQVSQDFLTVAAGVPVHGRGFTAAEFAPGGPVVAIISFALWQQRYERTADLTGRTIRVAGVPVPIVGVLPESFAFPYVDEPVGVIVPLQVDVDPDDVAEDWNAIARLSAGVSRDQARAEIEGLTAAFRTAYPKQVAVRDRGMTVATFGELYVARGVQNALWMLAGAVACVLLVANANVACLFLSRASARRQEIAVRAALGASRSRIARLVLMESVLIAGVAGVTGLGVGTWMSGTLAALAPIQVLGLSSTGIDWRVMAFTVGASLSTSLFFGGVAAWPAFDAGLAPVLNEASRGNASAGRARFGLLLVQSFLTMILLVGAGLLTATLSRLADADLGFDVQDLVVVRTAAPLDAGATAQDLWEFEQRVFRRLEGAPAVAAFAAVNSVPFGRGMNTPVSIVGRPDAKGTVEWRAVTPRYFETLGIGREAGRGFEASDIAGSPPVAIVNSSFARAYFAGADAIGQHISIGSVGPGHSMPGIDQPRVEVIGVVANVRDVSARSEPRPTIYVPQSQASSLLSTWSRTWPVVIAKRRQAGNEAFRILRDAVQAAQPSLPPPQVLPLSEVLTRSLARERFGSALSLLLAILALGLTACGVYGVLAYEIRRRRREIGIRMALGAGAPRVVGLVMMQGVLPVFTGMLAGAAAAVGMSRLAAGFLWGVTPTDPATYAGVATILLGVAALASGIPAQIAASREPARALGED